MLLKLHSVTSLPQFSHLSLAYSDFMNIFNVFYEPTAMTHAELKAVQKEAYARFYGRPLFLALNVWYVKDPDGLGRSFQIASQLGRHMLGF